MSKSSRVRNPQGRFLLPGTSKLPAPVDTPESEESEAEYQEPEDSGLPSDNNKTLPHHDTPPHLPPAPPVFTASTPIASASRALTALCSATSAATVPPVPASVDPVLWANNQALILALLLQALTPAAPAPAHHQKEAGVQAPTKFSGDEQAKLRDFLYECGLVFDARPLTYATDKARIIYAIQHLTGTAKSHFRRDIEQGYHSQDPYARGIVAVRSTCL